MLQKELLIGDYRLAEALLLCLQDYAAISVFQQTTYESPMKSCKI